MKTSTLSFAFLILWLSVIGQNQSSDFVTILVEKRVKDFPDKFDLSSPAMAEVTILYMLINGEDGLWSRVSSSNLKYAFPVTTYQKSNVPEQTKEKYLNTIIKEYIVYKDSIACTISLKPDSSFDIRMFNFEKGSWVNIGDDSRSSLQLAENHFKLYANQLLVKLRRTLSYDAPPSSDTLAFVNYLRSNRNDPVEFVLKKLDTYKLVIYGEIHRRTNSWDFCTSLVNDNQFVASTGTVFMEFESNKQQQIDQLMASDSLDKEQLMNIFRDYMLVGWNDKGRYDFLISIWQLNRRLPDKDKIKVVFVDTPRIFTEEGLKNELRDRDNYMATQISEILNTSQDPRHALFIVGSSHVFRTGETAGAILCKEMEGSVYTVFTHCPVVDNFMEIPERIRKGMFDYAFYQNNNNPIAFELKNSPFGKEPFDGLYMDGSGNFQDNYDGYLFFESLDTEKSPALLVEMYDDRFIREMDRRFKLLGGDLKDEWDLKELSVSAVLDVVNKEYTPLRWSYLKPLDKE